MTRRKLIIVLLVITAVLLIGGLYFYFEAIRDYRESDGARVESFKVHNEDLLKQFINEIVING